MQDIRKDNYIRRKIYEKMYGKIIILKDIQIDTLTYFHSSRIVPMKIECSFSAVRSISCVISLSDNKIALDNKELMHSKMCRA